MTKFVQLRPTKSKRAPEIAYILLVSIFGAPSVLQNDNGSEFVNSVIVELCFTWEGLKMVHGKPRPSQRQGSAERANRDMEDMLTTWLQSNSTDHWADGLRFVQVMKNRNYQEGIKCTPYKTMFGQPMKDEAIDDIRTEEELKEIIDSIQEGNLPMEN